MLAPFKPSTLFSFHLCKSHRSKADTGKKLSILRNICVSNQRLLIVILQSFLKYVNLTRVRFLLSQYFCVKFSSDVFQMLVPFKLSTLFSFQLCKSHRSKADRIKKTRIYMLDLFWPPVTGFCRKDFRKHIDQPHAYIIKLFTVSK